MLVVTIAVLIAFAAGAVVGYLAHQYIAAEAALIEQRANTDARALKASAEAEVAKREKTL